MLAEKVHICTAHSPVVNVHPQVCRHGIFIHDCLYTSQAGPQSSDVAWWAGGAFEEEFEEAAPVKKELFYTEGPASLKQARLKFAHFSLDRAASRLAGAKRKRESPDEDEEAERADTVSLMTKVCTCIGFHLRGTTQKSCHHAVHSSFSPQ